MQANYVVVNEFGDVYQAEAVTSEDLDACKDGLLTILSIDPPVVEEYINGSWVPIQTWPINARLSEG